LEPDVLLDGARAALTAPPPPRQGYALKVSGKGLKTIHIIFWSEVVGDDLRQVQFDIPRIVQSRLSLRLPRATAFPQALVHLGSQRITEDESGLLLDADLGAPMPAEASAPSRPPVPGPSVPLHLRWREPQPGVAARVRFKEAYLWDLGQRDKVGFP